jgi:hypothetical protein
MWIPDDAQRAILLKNTEAGLLAIALAENVDRLPKTTHGQWERLATFPLGVQEVMPVDIAPEPVLRAVKAEGFFTWPARHMLPFGTSQ